MLAQLVGLRIWDSYWKREGVTLAMSADNMTSLHLADFDVRQSRNQLDCP